MTLKFRLRNIGARTLFMSVSPVLPSNPMYAEPYCSLHRSPNGMGTPVDGVKLINVQPFFMAAYPYSELAGREDSED